VFITINLNGSINKIEENWEKPTFFIQDGGYLFTNYMSGAARLPALFIRIKEKWQNILEPNEEFDWKCTFYSSTNDTKLRPFHYKFINIILPCYKYILTCKLPQSSLCEFCEYQIKTVEHLFWECHITQTLWNNF